MAIDFPNSPSAGQIYTVSGKQWIHDTADGGKWIAYGASLAPDILKVDSANNRVGINQTTPTEALDVTGNVNVTGNLTVAGTTVTLDLASVLVKDRIVFEGSSADAYETTLIVTNPTGADKTITLPNATGTVTLDGAPLASPTFTGVPAAPTAAADTNTTQIATTAYVQTELGAVSSDSIADADANTKIQVEESSDENIIRFDTAGTERMTISAAGVVATVGDLTVGGNATIQSLDMDTIVAGDIIYGSGADTLARLAKGTDTHVLTLASGVPTWAVGGSAVDDESAILASQVYR